MTAAIAPEQKKRGRPRKDNVVVLEQADRAAKEKVAADNSFQLGGRTWHVNPIQDRNTDECYDDAADFLELAIPVIQKIFSSVVSATAVGAETGLNLKGKSMLEQMAFMLDIAEDLDLVSVLKDIRRVLPEMGAIICRGEDSTVTASDIRRWAGSPLNPHLLNAVIMQIGADSIIPNLLQLGALFMGGEDDDGGRSEGGEAAGSTAV